MIRDTLEAHVVADVHGRPLAFLGSSIGEGAEVSASDARRIARLFEALAAELDPERRGRPGRDVTITDPTGDTA